jgi:hypothetical protein
MELEFGEEIRADFGVRPCASAPLLPTSYFLLLTPYSLLPIPPLDKPGLFIHAYCITFASRFQ